MKYIIGIGNYSMFDDSIGLRIIEHIYRNNLDTGFSAIDLSSNSLNLFTYLDKKTEQILIIDSLKGGKDPGNFIFFRPEDVRTEKQSENFSTHEGDIMKVIELAKATKYYIPPITIMGVEAAVVKNEFGLSGILEDRLQTYVDEAIRFIKKQKAG
jgi:hydrogenase maturation protease